MSKMKYIDSWLSGLGLQYLIPKLQASNVTTPKRLAQLSAKDIYEVVGDNEEDRRKISFLIQRLQKILSSKGEGDKNHSFTHSLTFLVYISLTHSLTLFHSRTHRWNSDD